MNFSKKVVSILVGAQIMCAPLLAVAHESAVPVAYAGKASGAAVVSVVYTPTPECSVTSSASVGSRGDEVACLQARLIKEGHLKLSAPTGYFGEATKNALMQWQKAHGVASTGFFGSVSRTLFSSEKAGRAAVESHPYYDELQKSHKAMMEAFMSTSTSGMSMDMPDTRKVIAVVLYDEFEPLDAIGPLEVLGQLRGYKVVTVAKQKGEIASAFGTKMAADYSFDELKHPAIIVVPGGLFGTIAASKDAATLAWLREADKTSEYTTSVCTGAWILAAAGFLSGRQASTHWTGAEYLEDFGVKYTGKRYTIDGKYITAAGVSAGIDMSFKLIAMIGGDDAAKVAQLGLEYDPQPPFDAGSPTKADPELVRIMREQMKDHMMAAQMMYGTATTAMTMSHDAMHATATTTGMADMHMHGPLDVSSWSAVPEVTIQMHPDVMGGWNLEIKTKNFTFAPEHVNGPVVAGEGHAHLYIDGKKVTRVYGNWLNIPAAMVGGSGSHEIVVTLNANDHSDLSSKGSRIQAAATVLK